MQRSGRGDEYYERTAREYAALHMRPKDGHYIALEYIVGLAAALGVRSILDVGAGLGRAASFIATRASDVDITSIEPSAALIQQSHANSPRYVRAIGEKLPFADQSFDAVLATGTLHHTPQPPAVISEMTRVARVAVFLSDANRFGQGRFLVRLAKLSLYRLRLWDLTMWLRTRGTRTLYSEGDGEFYSYSLFDSYEQVEAWGDRTFLIPTVPASSRSRSPLVSSSQLLLCGVREPEDFGVP